MALATASAVDATSPYDSLSYTLPELIDRLVDEEGMDEVEAGDLFDDTLRFLYMCGTTGEALVPTERIDIAWHHFILYTRMYREFCHKYFDRFIEHRPFSREERAQRSFPTGMSPCARTLYIAKALFGPNLSKNWDISKKSGADCEGSTNCQSSQGCASPGCS